MEEFHYKMINIFNKNFICNDVKKIINLYKKDISNIQYSEKVNLKLEKYQHPLFMNYNYCLFCEEKEKTKYYLNKLINNHINLEEKTIGEFLFKNNIKLREFKGKKEKISKRRFINSYDNFIKNENYNNNNNKITIKPNDESDTELYIYNNKLENKIINNLKIKNNIINENNFNKEKNLKKFNTKNLYRKSISKDYQNYQKKITYNNLNFPIEKFNKITENYKKELNLNNSKKEEQMINFENTNINNENDKETDDYILEVKNNDFFRNKKKTKTIKSKNEKILIDSINENSKSKLDISKRENRKEKNDEKGIKIIDYPEDDKSSKKSKNNFLQVINDTKKFFGIAKRFSQGKMMLKHSGISNNLGESKDLNRNQTVKEKLKNKTSQNIIEKNDNCSICFQEIKEKFTLICGDFFCRQCIRETILTAIKTISNLDKLSCPTCNELLEENTIKKLLSDEEFNKYKNLITKITGLKNKDKDIIPCPYPDCPGWVKENQSNHNIMTCQYQHTFCKKCLKVLDNTEKNNHQCNENYTEEEKKTLEFFKENKNFRKCPNCQSMVVREGSGCNNMTCTNVWCGYEFCWICNRKYDESHYKNPLSMCFGLSDTNYEGKLAKNSRARFCRCLFIFFLLIFIIFPIIIVFFSIFEAALFIVTFVLDGSVMKNIKLKSLNAHKFFYKIVYGFFIAIGVAFIPFGYLSLAVFIVFMPIFLIVNKIKQKRDEELD